MSRANVSPTLHRRPLPSERDPVGDALPALREHFKRYPDDDRPQTREQMREMCKVAVRYMRASKTLLDYAEATGGRVPPVKPGFTEAIPGRVGRVLPHRVFQGGKQAPVQRPVS